MEWLAKVFDTIKNFYGAIQKSNRDEQFLKRGLCPLHECKLQNGEVSIVYGLVRLSEEHRAAAARFPLACSKAMGGCFVYEGQPKTKLVDYCEQCRKAEADWLAGNS